jgi:hypothetical protein
MDYSSLKANPDYSFLPDRGGQIFDGYPCVHHKKASLNFQVISHGPLATRRIPSRDGGRKILPSPPF